MIVIERPDVAATLLNRARGNQAPRGKGFHQSDHTRCLIKSTVSKLVDEELEEGLELMFLRGQGIGMFLSQSKPEEIFYAPGFGYCSIDRPWEDDDGNIVPMELKSTRFSSRGLITEHANYISQLATYVIKKLRNERSEINSIRRQCDLPELDSPVVEHSDRYSGFLYVLFELGDYTDRKPEQRAFEFKFSGIELLVWEGELDRRHELLVESRRVLADPDNEAVQYAIDRIRDRIPIEFGVLEDVLPPVKEHFDWECDKYSECPLRVLINCPGTESNAQWGLPFFIEEETYTRREKPKAPPKPRKGKSK